MPDSGAALGEDEFREKLRGLNNWDRWGADDQRGAVNLIDASKILRSVGAVAEGRTVSLSREYPTTPAANNRTPAQQFMRRNVRGDGSAGSAVDHLALSYHGQACTHLDALSHVWNRDGMWNGRDPDEAFTFDGMTWGGVEHWSNGIVTRGVLLDVAANREGGFVEAGAPVTAEELRSLVDREGIQPEPGDALVIHSGRDRWEQAHGRPWGSANPDGTPDRAGLAASCLEFFHEVDCSVVIWDMSDARPNDYGVPHSTHAVLFNQGVALLDNASLEPLAAICDELDRHAFLVVIAPLVVVGGTGSPVNPIAVL